MRKFIFIMTVVNLCILICFIVCVFRVSDMNREINAVGNEFKYIEVKENEVSLDLDNSKTVTMKFVKDGVIIRDAYAFDNPESISKILCFVKYYAENKGYKISCSNVELIGEYRLHTILYKIGYKPEKTGTLNWDFCGDRRWYVNTLSAIFGWCGI